MSPSYCKPEQKKNEQQSICAIFAVDSLRRSPFLELVLQNRTHAVMSQRAESGDSLDDFPTPPWATRALLAHVIQRADSVSSYSCLEPACGVGHMAKVLAEYFKDVSASDVYDFGYGPVENFLEIEHQERQFDWVITNPPFRLAEQFVLRALPIARRGVAMLTRTVFLESVGRYHRLFSNSPPSKVAQFTERVPMVKGRLDQKASTATGYAWLVWESRSPNLTELVWIPPCRKSLEYSTDYDLPESPLSNSVKRQPLLPGFAA